MAKIKGSQTEKNLLKAFAGESQARNRYTYYASAARKEGYVHIANIFEETANQEVQHAKRFFKFLLGGEVEITATFPAGKIGTTEENLMAAAAGEYHEHSVLYPEFAKVAHAEGFTKVAHVFKFVSVAEEYHERRYRDLLHDVSKNAVFARSKSITWYCINCGYVHQGLTAPKKCPACAHVQAYFKPLEE